MKDIWTISFEDFRSFLRLERSLSENTVASYLSDLKKLKRFVETDKSISSKITPEELSSENLKAFLGVLLDNGTKKRSQARVLSSIKAYYKYLVLEGKIKDNPCDLLDAPKIKPYYPTVLTLEEVLSILSSIDLSREEGHRNRAIIEMLYSCGLRVSELTNMRVSDLFLDDGFVKVVGKGNKQRLVPMGEPAIDAVVNYLDKERRRFSLNSSSDYLFLNRRGGKLSREMVFLLVKKYGERAGIEKDISPHTFRHSFATALVENGADLRVVQQMLGHESILTTEIYTHIDSKKWQSSILEHHPKR